MKRLALIFLLCGLAIPFAWGAETVVDLFNQAQAAAKVGKFDDAVQLYERVLTEHPEANNRWSEAQMGIAQTLAKKGDWDGAAKAAHICLDAASNLNAFDNAVTFTANILSAQDKNVDRANQFIKFQLSGGADGTTNPMDAVGYPSLPEREKAFALLRPKMGDDANACKYRAVTYLFTGKPKDALAQYADAFRRHESPYDLSASGSELVTIGLRAARGHRVGLDKAMQFVIYGPNGPDGKPGTADDLPDPFAPLMPPVPEAGIGGLSEMPADDLAVLQNVRDAAQVYAGDPSVPWELRRTAFGTLIRLNNALDGWGAPGQKDWYLRLALGVRGPPVGESITDYIIGLQFAARGRATHYGGVRALFDEIDATCAAQNIETPGYLKGLHAQFDKICDALEKVQFPKQNLTPLQKPATF